MAKQSETVIVDKDALNALMDAFDLLSSGQASRLSEWLSDDYGMTEAEFDEHLKGLGEVMGRDFGIL